MSAEAVDCAVLLVGYNSADHLERMLDSLPAAAGRLTTTCLLVDNASTDGTPAIARRRPDVTLLESGGNLGYSGAINLGRRTLPPHRSLLIVNPDLVLDPGSVEALFEALGSMPEAGIAVPRLLDSGGELYLTLRREPTLLRTVGDTLFGARWPSRSGWLGETFRDAADYERPQDPAWAAGAAMLISARCEESVGDWDATRFFLYSEETDFAIRARRAGFRLRYVPGAIVRHDEGGSGTSPLQVALLSVNRIRLYEKYHRPPLTWLFRGVVVLHHLLRVGVDPTNRFVLRVLARRRRWGELPGGIPG